VQKTAVQYLFYFLKKLNKCLSRCCQTLKMFVNFYKKKAYNKPYPHSHFFILLNEYLRYGHVVFCNRSTNKFSTKLDKIEFSNYFRFFSGGGDKGLWTPCMYRVHQKKRFVTKSWLTSYIIYIFQKYFVGTKLRSFKTFLHIV